MAPSPITAWQIDGQKVETVTDFIFLGSKITVHGDCSRKIKRHSLLGRKAMTNLDIIFKKQRHYSAYKGLSSQSYVLSSSHVQMWQLDHKEIWALKNWCFQNMVLHKMLESPLDCKKINPVNLKGNQSWMFIGRTGAEAETQYFCHLMRKADSLGKTLMLGNTVGKRRREWQRVRWLDGITDSTETSLSKLREVVKNREAELATVHRVTKSWTQLNDWTTTI